MHIISRRLFPRSASALLITLAMVVLMTILAIGLFTATRIEVSASKLHLDGVRSELFARVAESVALARLQAATSGTNRMWLSQPGRLITSPSNSLWPVTNIVDLHSGEVLPGIPTDDFAEFNPALLQNTNNRLIVPASAFSGADSSMRLRWIYVRKDGSLDTNAPPVLDAGNPVVGRMAFWVDDESAKVNVNTAWGRTPATANVPSSDSIRIDLGSLVGGATGASDVVAFRTNNHAFNSPIDVLQVGGLAASAVATNAHLLTPYNHSPNLNMFGERRIVLTTQKRIAEQTYPDLIGDPDLTNYYLDIFVTGKDNIDPGSASLANIDVDKVSRILRLLLTTLNRTDWPNQPGTSYSAKFTGTNVNAWTVQTLADVIDYVRSKESTNLVVSPLQYNPVNANTLSGVSRLAADGGNASLGTARAPLITELAAWISPTKIGNKFAAQFFAEVYMPVGTMNLAEYRLRIGAKIPSGTNHLTFLVPISSGATSLPGTDSANAYVLGGSPALEEGGYRTLTVYHPGITVTSGSGPGGFTTNRPTEMAFYAQLESPAGERIARGPNENTQTKPYYSYAVAATNVPIGSITSMSTVDPFVGKSGSDFIQQPNTFSAANPPSPAYSDSGAFSPQLDADASGVVVTNRTRPPDRKGSTVNPNGVVESVAELGAVHIGLNGDAGPGVPWRTIRLQPLMTGRNELPDWNLLDLFCAPARRDATSRELRFARPEGNVGGVVNLNVQAIPFVDAGGSPAISKTNVLSSFLTGARTNGTSAISSSVVENLVQSIASKTLAAAAGNQGRIFGQGEATNFLFSSGQIVELAGVADQGEKSELMLADLLDLASTRSGVFTVYSVGQAVQQDPQGEIKILAETRHQNTVELVREVNGETTTRAIFVKKLHP